MKDIERESHIVSGIDRGVAGHLDMSDQNPNSTSGTAVGLAGQEATTHGRHDAHYNVVEAAESRASPLENDLQEFLQVLWRRKIPIAATICLVMATTLSVLPFVPPRYTAEALIQIEPATNIIDIDAVVAGISNDSSSILGEVQVLQSRDLARSTIRKLGLDKQQSLELVATGSSGQDIRPWARVREAIGQRVRTGGDLTANGSSLTEEDRSASIGAAGKALLNGGTKGSVVQEDTALPVRLVDGFLRGLRVAPVSRSNVISVRYVAGEPEIAAQIVNTLADLYIETQLGSKLEATKLAADAINERLKSLENAVEESEHAIESFRADMGLIDGVQASLLTEQVSRVNAELAIARTELAEAQARLAEVQPGVSVDHLAEVLDSPVIQQLRAEETSLSQQYAQATEQYGPRHPVMVSMVAEAVRVRDEIDQEIERIVGNISTELRISEARVSALERELKALEDKAIDANRAGVRVRTLERDADANRNLYQTFLDRYKETAIQDGLLQADARVISYADVPTSPSQPQKKLVTSLALVASSLLGLGLALVIERLDSNGFRSADQIEQTFGMPVLGFVPRVEGSGRKNPAAYLRKHPQSAFTESIRSLQTGILLSEHETPLTLAITSSVPAESKTTLSLSLTRMLASNDRSAIVVDCDMRRPTLHRMAGISKEPGLSGYLSSDAPLESIINTDVASGAEVICAGEMVADSAELLRSRRMGQLLESLRERCDYVILDTPPVLPVADGHIICSMADRTLFLVRWRDTRKKVVLNAFKKLRKFGVNLIGIAITQVNVRQHAQYAYSDSGYYYGDYRKYYSDGAG